jgi:sulfur carrier protein
MQQVMRIEVNGESREVPEGTTVSSLLVLLGVTAPRVAVELNTRVVTRALHPLTALQGGDRVEVVTFVGGG